MILGLASAALVQPPHILISQDARLVGFFATDTLFPNASRVRPT